MKQLGKNSPGFRPFIGLVDIYLKHEVVMTRQVHFCVFVDHLGQRFGHRQFTDT